MSEIIKIIDERERQLKTKTERKKMGDASYSESVGYICTVNM